MKGSLVLPLLAGDILCDHHIACIVKAQAFRQGRTFFPWRGGGGGRPPGTPPAIAPGPIDRLGPGGMGNSSRWES